MHDYWHVLVWQKRIVLVVARVLVVEDIAKLQQTLPEVHFVTVSVPASQHQVQLLLEVCHLTPNPRKSCATTCQRVVCPRTLDAHQAKSHYLENTAL